MYSRDYRDIVAGALLVLIGAFAAIYALYTLRLGTMANMGPGMFPFALGFILFVFGGILLASALFRKGEMPVVDARSFIAVMTAILAFAIMVRPFGLVPAVFALIAIASRADGKLSLPGTLLLAVTLSVGSTLIFQVGLGMPIRPVAWPW